MRTAFIILIVLLTAGCASTSKTYNEGGSIRARTATGTEVIVSQSDNPRTGATLRVVDTPDGPAIEASTGETFENTVARVSEMFGAFRIYHLAAIGCAIVGVLILGTGFLPNRWGICLLGLAAALGTWAHLAPSYGGYFAIALGLFALLGAGYWLYEKGHFSPVPEQGRVV